MKNLFCLFVLAILFTSCYDNFRFGEPAGVIEDIPTDVPEVKEDDLVYFADFVKDQNNKALANVEVAVYADGIRYSDLTDARGEYVIEVPADDLPQSGFISLSITKEEYVPYNSTYPAPLNGGEVYETDVDQLLLSPCPNCLKLGDKSSELFHLGDDNYGGTENSQFQKTTDGTEVDIQLQETGGFGALKISFEIKGIQPIKFENKSSVQFYAGSDLVDEKLIDVDSPIDGSFGTYTMSVDNTRTITSFRFITRNHGTVGSDYDDWEFTCLYAEGL